MTPTEIYLDAALALQGLPVAQDWRAAVLAHFEAIAKAAELVLAVPLDDEVEAAPTFAP